MFFPIGGIEKVCRVAGKALNELALQYGGQATIFAMYGKPDDGDRNNYFPQLIYTPFNAARVRFVRKAIAKGCRSNVGNIESYQPAVSGLLNKIIQAIGKAGIGGTWH